MNNETEGIMKNIIEKLGITLGEFRIRKCIDDSGDYERHTYDILDCYPWGSNCITGDIAHPEHARVFATSPKVIASLIKLMRGIEGLPPLTAIAGVLTEEWNICEIALKEATGKSWEEIKDLFNEQ